MANIIFIFCIVVKCIKNIDTILFDMIFQKARMQITVSLTSSKNAVNFIHRNIFPNSGRRLKKITIMLCSSSNHAVHK